MRLQWFTGGEMMRQSRTRHGQLLALAALLSLAGGCRKPHRVFAVRLADHKPAATHAPHRSGYFKHARSNFKTQGRRDRTRRGRIDKIDVNRAGLSEFMRLPGMQRREAERILRARPLANKRELLLRALVTPSQYRRWAPYLVARQASPRR